MFAQRFAQRAVALALLLVSMISVQAGASIAKRLFPILGAGGVSALRLTLAAVILCVINRPWRFPLTRTMRRTLVLYGIVLGAMNFLFYLALARVPLGVAVALEFTGPLAVALLASRQPRDILWALLAAVGIAAIIAPGLSAGMQAAQGGVPMGQMDPMGIVYALGAGVCWGLYIVVGQRAGVGIPGGVATTAGMIVASGVVILACLAQRTPVVLPATMVGEVAGVGCIVAILSSALPYSLEMVALQRLPTKTFGICMSLEPALGAIMGMLVLGEHLISTQWIGMTCVMLASIGSLMMAPPTVTVPPKVDIAS